MGPMASVIVLLLGLLVLVGVGVKLYDLKRKREAEGVHVQAQVSDALLRDPSLFGLAVTPTAHVPWCGCSAHWERSACSWWRLHRTCRSRPSP